MASFVLASSDCGQEPVTDSCEDGSEPSGYIK
jgi:hypothetical protein